MNRELLVALAGLATFAFVCALLLTRLVQRHAERRGLLDVPNYRSSHKQPTPRGGGIAIVMAACGAFLGGWWLGRIPANVAIAFAGGIAVAAIGYRDDHRPVAPLVRLLVHLAAAAWAIQWLGGLPPMQVGEALVGFGRFAPLLGVIGIIWVLNLFNFMDGIDGIAAGEAAFIGIAGGVMALSSPGNTGVALAAIAFGAACLGFLVFNWAPASIFMGDVGSGFLGFVVASLAIWNASTDPVGLLVWVILGGVFFVDATLTLLRRLSRRERVFEAHRSHAYQWLSRRWESHSRATSAVLATNFLWLLPWALAARAFPTRAGWFALAALVPLIIVAWLVGSGRAESADSTYSKNA